MDGGNEAIEGSHANETTTSPSSASDGENTAGISNNDTNQKTRAKSASTLAIETGTCVELEEPSPPTNDTLNVDGKTGLTPTAAAWTPGVSFQECSQQEEPVEADVVAKEPNDVKTNSSMGSAYHDAAGSTGDRGGV